MTASFKQEMRIVESIRQGLQEVIDFAEGKPLCMTQAEFASAFGISLGTLRHWERGDRRPRGPTRVLLNIVAQEPKTVLRALSGGRNSLPPSPSLA